MKHFDACAGLGGFTKAFMDAFGKDYECIGFSEINKHAIANYKYHYPNHKNYGDLNFIQPRELPDFDIFTAGFPCQPFSIAGKGQGFEDTRGTIFFEIARILKEKKPKFLVLENVKGLLNHRGGRTFSTIYKILAEIGYTIEFQLLNTRWVRPQNRQRIYIVGHLGGKCEQRVFPFTEDDFLSKGSRKIKKRQSQTKIYSTTITNKIGNRATDTFIEVPKIAGTLTVGGNSGGLHSDMTTIKIGAFRGRNPENPKSRERGLLTEQVLEINQDNISNCLTSVTKDNVVVGTWRTYNDGKGFRQVADDNCPTIPARARQDGSGQPVISDNEQIRRFTEIECERLQGFPDNWTKFGIYEKKIWINKKEKTFKIIEGEFPIPKTERYRLLGNAVTYDMPFIIANRLKAQK